MDGSKIKEKIKINEDKPFLKLYILVIALITIIVTLFRIASYFVTLDYLSTDILMIMIRGRDIDFVILFDSMENGLYGMYIPPPGYLVGHFYLYYWYFIFYPIYILPMDFSLYIWDGLRLLAVAYIARNLSSITKNKKELLLVLVFNAIAYAVDMFLNNTNWLILLLLFESYRSLEKDQKVLSGILFAIATYKIIVIIFPFILLITKKIKLKELVYYLAPFVILFVPYLINPPYFWQMYANWTASDIESSSFILSLLYIVLKIFEPAQLMFVSFGFFLIYVNFEKDPWKKRAFYGTLVVMTTMFVFYLVLMGMFTRAPT